MIPIHLAIGIMEGIATFFVISFVRKAQPGIITSRQEKFQPARHVIAVLAIAALLVGGLVSWFSSDKPDGLEWSISKVTGKEELGGSESKIESFLLSVQEKIAFLPNYDFKPSSSVEGVEKSLINESIGTSTAGILGAFMVFSLAGVAGFTLRNRSRIAKDV
jgi:cobalt/nickel transport system permease protein